MRLSIVVVVLIIHLHVLETVSPNRELLLTTGYRSYANERLKLQSNRERSGKDERESTAFRLQENKAIVQPNLARRNLTGCSVVDGVDEQVLFSHKHDTTELHGL